MIGGSNGSAVVAGLENPGALRAPAGKKWWPARRASCGPVPGVARTPSGSAISCSIPKPARFVAPDERFELTPIEFSLLELFLRNPRKVLTRASISFTEVWGRDHRAEHGRQRPAQRVQVLGLGGLGGEEVGR